MTNINNPAYQKWNDMKPLERLAIMQEVQKVKKYKKISYFQRACIEFIKNNQ